MKFTASRQDVLRAIEPAARARGRRSGVLPVLGGIHVAADDTAVTFTGSNLELTVSATLDVVAEDRESCVLPGLFVDVVKSFADGPVSVDTGSGEAVVSSGRSVVRLRLLDADDYPVVRAVDPTAEVDAAVFGVALSRVVVAASTDDSRPILTGVLFRGSDDGLVLAATDSYRLVEVTVPVSGLPGKMLLPRHAAAEVGKLDGPTIKVGVSERMASFSAGGTTVTSRLIEGEFPPYRQLIDGAVEGARHDFTVDADDLDTVVRRVKLLAQDSTPVALAFKGDEIEVTARTTDVGVAADVVAYDGGADGLTVAFNPAFFHDALVGREGPVRFRACDALKPAVIGGDDWVAVLMPVRQP